MMGALVTGAAGSIGSAIVRALVADDVRVAAVDRVDSTNLFPDLIADGRVSVITGDLSTTAGRADATARARASLGQVRWLVNDAADCTEVALVDSSDEHWRKILETNLIAPAALVRLLADDLCRTNGVVVNVSSVRGMATLPGAAAYEASKAGLLALTRTVTAELGPRGARAVAVCPGAIAPEPDAWINAKDSDERAAWRASQPHGRVGSPEGVAEVVAFLCSDMAHHVSGVEVVVDGGVIAQYPAGAAMRAIKQAKSR